MWRFAAAGALLGCVLALPSAAPANNVSNAAATPEMGGGVALAIPSDGHQVYRVKVSAKDWIIAYSWAPGSIHALGSVRVLDPSASEVASPAVATSGSSGAVCYQASVTGTYCVDYTAPAGTHIVRGLFTSRAKLVLRGSHTVAIPYGGSVTPACTFTDALYNYIGYDGPTVPFEGVALTTSADGVNFKTIWSGPTNVSGIVGHPVSHLTKRTFVRFSYSGQLYDSAALGPALSDVFIAYPRVKFSLKAPASATHGVAFAVTGSVQPKLKAGATSVVVQATVTGGPRLSFACTALASSSSTTPLRASVILPSAGAWSVRLYRPTDSSNAETATKWVRVNVR